MARRRWVQWTVAAWEAAADKAGGLLLFLVVPVPSGAHRPVQREVPPRMAKAIPPGAAARALC